MYATARQSKPQLLVSRINGPNIILINVAHSGVKGLIIKYQWQYLALLTEVIVTIISLQSKVQSKSFPSQISFSPGFKFPKHCVYASLNFAGNIY